jgi:ribosome biogenesis GTPase A
MNIQWYPGHMTKTRRLIAENLKHIDAVCEIIDARIPISSRNPDINELSVGKPRLIILNRTDLSDPALNKRWSEYFQNLGLTVVETDSKTGSGVSGFVPAVKNLLGNKLSEYIRKGQTGRTLKVMICGIPNVGKSTFINRVAKKNAAQAEDRPGVTRNKQWIHADSGLDMMDTPGILWPRFDDKLCGLYLAFTGAVKDEILDIEELAVLFFEKLVEKYPESIRARYKTDFADSDTGFDILKRAARSRGFLRAGGREDTERMAKTLFLEFRSGKLGRITLEAPEEANREPLKEIVFKSSFNDMM